MGFTRICYLWTNRTFSRLTMQIGSTIAEIHLKYTHFTYTVAAPAPQNTPDYGNRINTPASVKCRQASPNSSLIHYVKLYISIRCVYTQARTHRPYKREKKPFGNLSWIHVMSHFAFCSNSHKVDLNYTRWFLKIL